MKYFFFEIRKWMSIRQVFFFHSRLIVPKFRADYYQEVLSMIIRNAIQKIQH